MVKLNFKIFHEVQRKGKMAAEKHELKSWGYKQSKLKSYW